MALGGVAQFFEDIFDFLVDDVLLLTLALAFFFIMAWIIPKIWTMISRGLYISGAVTKATTLFLRVIIAFVGIGLSFAALGLDVTQLVTTLGIVGIVVGLGLQQLLALLSAGLIIRSRDDVAEGDIVVLSNGNVRGVVRKVTSINTEICSVEDENVVTIVPNTQWLSMSFDRTRHDVGYLKGLTGMEITEARSALAKIYLAQRKQKEMERHYAESEFVIPIDKLRSSPSPHTDTDEDVEVGRYSSFSPSSYPGLGSESFGAAQEEVYYPVVTTDRRPSVQSRYFHRP